MKNHVYFYKYFWLFAIYLGVAVFANRTSFAGTLTLGSATGVAGQEITFTGASYDANATYTFCMTFDGTVVTVTATSQLVTAAGAFPTSGNASFIVPSAAFGTHLIRAYTISSGTCASPGATPTNFAVTTFTINTATVVVTSPAIPTTGVAIGTNITVTGANFEGIAANTINVYFDDTTSTIATATPSKTGAWDVTFAIPNVNNTGTHVIKVTQSNSTYVVANTTVVVATPSITLNPSTAVVGQTVTITGTNFKALDTVTINYNNTAFSPAASATANGAGSFAATFVVPDVVAGTLTIKSASSTITQLYATTTLTVSTPTLTLLPATAVVGQTVTITGTLFKAGTDVTLSYNGTALTTVTANAQGGFGTTFVVPDIVAGTATIKGLSTTTPSGILYATTTLTVSTPTLTLLPATAVVGQTVTITGTLFKASTTVTLSYNGTTLTTATTNEQGGFGTTFVVPDIVAGTATIKGLSTTTPSGILYATATLTVSTPTITLNPATANSGSLVTITGTNFKVNSTVTLYLNDSLLPLTGGGNTTTTNEQGVFVTSFTTPALPSTSLYTASNFQAANDTVRAVNYSNFYAVANLTIAPSSITVNPASGPDGLPIFIAGTGFSAGDTVSIYLNGDLIDDSTTANILGAFSTQINIPRNLQAGAQTIRAQTSTYDYANATYTVSSSTLSINPTAGSPGTRVTLTGTNFVPNQKVTIKWNGGVIEPKEKDLETSSNGAFTANITIPATFTPGTNQFQVIVKEDTIISNFTVAAATLTPSPTSSGPGAVVNITGANFEGSKEVTLKWDDGRVLSTNPAKIITTPLGGFFATFTVPAASRGAHTITAYAGSALLNVSASYVINTPTIITGNEIVRPNAKINVTGTYFSPNYPVTFLWDNDLKLETENATLADSSGGFSAVVFIPKNASPGKHSLKALTSNDTYNTVDYIVSNSIAELARTDLVSNASVKLSGSDFTVNSNIDIFIDGIKQEKVNLKTDTTGGFSYVLVLPLLSPGTHNVKVSTDDTNIAEVGFKILTPTLVTNPEKPKGGDKVTITGSNYSANSKIIISVNGKQVKTNPSEIKTDETGNFTATVSISKLLGSDVNIQASPEESVLGVSTSRETLSSKIIALTALSILLVAVIKNKSVLRSVLLHLKSKIKR